MGWLCSTKHVLHSVLLASHSLETDTSSSSGAARTIVSSSCLSRSQAAEAMDQHILPKTQYGHRISLGAVPTTTAHHPTPWRTGALSATDPILHETYGEFPLDSLDSLLDRAEQWCDRDTSPTTTVVDLGSGCGRLGLYLALSRPSSCVVHGVEVSPVYHAHAVEAVERACKHSYMEPWCEEQQQQESVVSSDARGGCRLELHLGPAEEYLSLLQKADVIFCYSTAFEGSAFSEEVGAMILGPYWNNLLSQTDAVVVTTDKALDPAYGWNIVDRCNVMNGEVCGSTGYIQTRRGGDDKNSYAG